MTALAEASAFMFDVNVQPRPHAIACRPGPAIRPLHGRPRDSEFIEVVTVGICMGVEPYGLHEICTPVYAFPVATPLMNSGRISIAGGGQNRILRASGRLPPRPRAEGPVPGLPPSAPSIRAGRKLAKQQLTASSLLGQTLRLVPGGPRPGEMERGGARQGGGR